MNPEKFTADRYTPYGAFLASLELYNLGVSKLIKYKYTTGFILP